MGLLLYWGIYKLGGRVFSAEAKVTVVVFRFQMSFPKYNLESWEISSSVITCSNHGVLESSRSFRNRGNFMIYFRMIASLPNAILWDVGTVILSRSTNSFGLIVYYRVASIEYPFQKHAKKSKDILWFGTGKPFILYDRRKMAFRFVKLRLFAYSTNRGI